MRPTKFDQFERLTERVAVFAILFCFWLVILGFIGLVIFTVAGLLR
jgi:hypothetical protein